VSNSVKFAVSLAGNEFKELESLRKKKGLTRSGFIREAIRLWKETKKREKMVRIYEEGYKRIPDNLSNIEAWEKASLISFSQEEW